MSAKATSIRSHGLTEVVFICKSALNKASLIRLNRFLSIPFDYEANRRKKYGLTEKSDATAPLSPSAKINAVKLVA